MYLWQWEDLVPVYIVRNENRNIELILLSTFNECEASSVFLILVLKCLASKAIVSSLVFTGDTAVYVTKNGAIQ